MFAGRQFDKALVSLEMIALHYEAFVDEFFNRIFDILPTLVSGEYAADDAVVVVCISCLLT